MEGFACQPNHVKRGNSLERTATLVAAHALRKLSAAPTACPSRKGGREGLFAPKASRYCLPLLSRFGLHKPLSQRLVVGERNVRRGNSSL